MKYTWRNDIQCEGLDAYMNGAPITSNPYDEESELNKYLQWRLGWCKVHDEAEHAVKQSA
jgi:hypothetical protein